MELVRSGAERAGLSDEPEIKECMCVCESERERSQCCVYVYM